MTQHTDDPAHPSWTAPDFTPVGEVWLVEFPNGDHSPRIAATSDKAKEVAESLVSDYFGDPITWTAIGDDEFIGVYKEHAYTTERVIASRQPILG